MVQRKEGHIVLVSSVAGKVPIPFRSSFAASKHALQAFSDALRAEMAIHNIKVLVSCPEYIPSDAQLTENDETAAPEEQKDEKKGTSRTFHFKLLWIFSHPLENCEFLQPFPNALKMLQRQKRSKCRKN